MLVIALMLRCLNVVGHHIRRKRPVSKRAIPLFLGDADRKKQAIALSIRGEMWGRNCNDMFQWSRVDTFKKITDTLADLPTLA